MRLPFFRSVADGAGDKSPFSAPGERGGVLCLHGFTGTPFEVRPVAEALAGLGWSVEAPLLAGHGGTVRGLLAVGAADWLASAEAALGRLQERAAGAPVAVVGFSMGGLLALRLAQLYPGRISALVLAAVPLRLRRAQTVPIRALRHAPRLLTSRALWSVPKLAGSDVSDPEARRANPCLRAMPVAALGQMLDLMDVVRPALASITVPTLVMHSHQDHTVPIDDSFELAGSIGSSVIERLWLRQSFHLVFVDVERSAAIARTAAFLNQHGRAAAR